MEYDIREIPYSGESPECLDFQKNKAGGGFKEALLH